jgi:hypothetical protein
MHLHRFRDRLEGTGGQTATAAGSCTSPILRAAPAALLLLAGWLLPARADVFDRYTNAVLSKATEADGLKPADKLTAALVAQHSQLLPGSSAALVVVKTNSGRYSKLLLQLARQRTAKGSLPIALIERFVTYKEGEEQAILSAGGPVHLYHGFHFSLDLGQVVPSEVGGDLSFWAMPGETWLQPVDSARLFVVTRPLPGTEARKLPRPMIGESFEARFFAGTYRLLDDGRRTARLVLRVSDEGQVSGEYVSEASGRSYEVSGRVGNPKHTVQFTVRFPQTEQLFQGWMFTHEGKYITGWTRIEEREFGWLAVRQDSD